jgi:uncharacterized MnhB-related membrane protein
MSIASVFDIALVALILTIGASAILVRTAFAAVVMFVVYGLLLSMAWVRLHAVDVALTEAAIGGGMTGLLLLGAVARSRSVNVDMSAVALSGAPCRRCIVCAGRRGSCHCHPPSAGGRSDARAHGDGKPAAEWSRQPRCRRAVRVSGTRHAARKGGPAARFARGLVAGARSCLGWNARFAGLRTARSHADLSGSAFAAGGNRVRNLYVLGRREGSWRRLSGRHGAGRDVAPCHCRGITAGPCDRSALATWSARHRTGAVPCHWPCWMGICRRISGLPGRLRQTADCRRGSRSHAVDRCGAWHAGRRTAGTGAQQ